MLHDQLLDLARYQELEVQLAAISDARTTAEEVVAVAELENRLAKHGKLAQVVERRLGAARKSLRTAELALAASEDTKKDVEAKLYGGEVTNPKELEQLEARLSHVNADLAAHEDAVLAAMEQIEELTTQQQKVALAQQKVSAALELARKRVAHRVSEWDLQEQVICDELAELRERIRPELIERYERLRNSTGGRPLAPLRKGVCGGCRTELPTTIRKRLESETIVTCERCSRILYWPE